MILARSKRSQPTEEQEDCEIDDKLPNLKVTIHSWNLGNAKLETVDELKKMLFQKSDPSKSDVLVFSFQEIVKLNAMFVLRKNKNNEAIVNWVSLISATIGSDFFMVSHKALVGLLIIVFAKKSIKTSIREVTFTDKKLGFNNSLGNKGAVAIRVDIDNCKFCFINCHLESGPSNLQKRIKQVNELHKISGFLSNLFDAREQSELKDSNGVANPFVIFDYLFL